MFIKSGFPDRADSRHSFKAVFRREEGKTIGGSDSGKRDEIAWRSSKIHFFFAAALILLLFIVLSACAEPEQAADYLSISGGWVYYCNQDAGGAIFKIRTDGSDRVRLNDHNSSKIIPARSWLFYRNKDDNFRIYKMRIDGSEITPLSDDRVSTLNLTHEWIYFGFIEGKGIGRIRHDGSGYEQMY